MMKIWKRRYGIKPVKIDDAEMREFELDAIQLFSKEHFPHAGHTMTDEEMNGIRAGINAVFGMIRENTFDSDDKINEWIEEKVEERTAKLRNIMQETAIKLMREAQ